MCHLKKMPNHYQSIAQFANFKKTMLVWGNNEITNKYTFLQGPQYLSVQSNLLLTDRKHAINFNLKVDSDQGRLGI